MAKKPLRTNVYENFKLLEEEQKLGLQLPYYFDNDFVIEKRLSSDLFDFILENKHKNNEKKIISMIFRGLLNLFKAGYVHLDLKPENILVEYDERQKKIKSVKITDLDLIRKIDSIIKMGDVAITPWYFDPLCITEDSNLELWKDKEEYKDTEHENIFAAPDLYSLGCIIYILYVEKLPKLSTLINKFLIGDMSTDIVGINREYDDYHEHAVSTFKEALKNKLDKYEDIFNRIDETTDMMEDIIYFLLNSDPKVRLKIMNDYMFKDYLLSDTYKNIWASSSESEEDGSEDEEDGGNGDEDETTSSSRVTKKQKVSAE